MGTNCALLIADLFSFRYVSVLLLWIICVIAVLFCYAFMHVCLLMPCGHLLGKGLTSWLSFVMSNCDVVTFPLVSWVRCGAWLYRFQIFTSFLTFMLSLPDNKQTDIIEAFNSTSRYLDDLLILIILILNKW